MDPPAVSWHAENPGAAFPVQKKSKRSRRLNNAGIAILEDFYKRVSEKPNAAQRSELLAKIRLETGLEDYEERKLKTWFGTRRRAAAAATSTSQAGPSGTYSVPSHTGSTLHFYPSLTEQSIKFLKTLLEPLPNPGPDIIKTWSTLLNATEHDVMAWIEARQAGEMGHPPHLPTPFESASPEPSPSSAFSSLNFKPEPPASPVISTLSTALSLHPPDGSTSTNKQVCEIRPSTRVMMRSLSDALSASNLTAVAAPKTATEFDALFAPYQTKMENMLQKIEAGSLKNWGWGPDMVKPVKPTD